MLRLQVQPNDTWLTRMLLGASSWAMLRVSPSNADLVVGYTMRFGCDSLPEIDPMMTTAPPPRARR